MTVVRLADGSLWLHSPVPSSASLRSRLSELGEVRFVVAPNRMHHLFVTDWIDAFPQAQLFGAPGLRAKRRDLKNLRELGMQAEPEWQEDLEQVFFEGVPISNETVWLHRASRTLILTDLCQWWQGELPFPARLYARITGVRNRLAVPRTIRLAIKDRGAARASAERILQWPFERVVVAHNSIVENDAHQAVRTAFACFR